MIVNKDRDCCIKCAKRIPEGAPCRHVYVPGLCDILACEGCKESVTNDVMEFMRSQGKMFKPHYFVEGADGSPVDITGCGGVQ